MISAELEKERPDMHNRERELLDALKALIDWEAYMGGWNDRCWDNARAIVGNHKAPS